MPYSSSKIRHMPDAFFQMRSRRSENRIKRKKASQTTAYQALVRIAAMYKIENTLHDMTAEERLRERKKSIAPLVDEFFAWVKGRLSDTTVLPHGKTAEGLNYCVDQEKYLRVFLTNGNVPMDNSASLYARYFYPHLLQRTA